MSGKYDDCLELSEKYQETERLLKASEKESDSKSYFLAQASHDLRQPLHALRIFAALLADTKLLPQQKNLIEKIIAAADNMHDLLNNYLDLSKLDYGGTKYEEHIFCLHELTDKLAEEFSMISICHHKHLHYIPCSLEIRSDKILLERMLRNLLTNAVKYAKRKIVFGCKRRGNFVQIIVMDDGIGISDADLPHIFDEFYQSGQNPENKKSGSGLGLAIVKKIADLFGTRIRVKTQPGQGTSFSFLLPAAKKKEA